MPQAALAPTQDPPTSAMQVQQRLQLLHHLMVSSGAWAARASSTSPKPLPSPTHPLTISPPWSRQIRTPLDASPIHSRAWAGHVASPFPRKPENHAPSPHSLALKSIMAAWRRARCCPVMGAPEGASKAVAQVCQSPRPIRKCIPLKSIFPNPMDRQPWRIKNTMQAHLDASQVGSTTWLAATILRHP